MKLACDYIYNDSEHPNFFAVWCQIFYNRIQLQFAFYNYSFLTQNIKAFINIMSDLYFKQRRVILCTLDVFQNWSEKV